MGKINEVRQILMNELGLSREFIRQESHKIIEEVVQIKVKAAVGQLVDSGTLDRIIRSELGKLASQQSWGGDGIKAAVMEASRKAAQEFVQNNLSIRAKP